MSESTEAIERDLEQDREHLRETLNAIEERVAENVAPERLMDRAMSYFETKPADFVQALGQQVRDNPGPALLTGAGIAWLILSERKRAGQNGFSERRSFASGEEEDIEFDIVVIDYESMTLEPEEYQAHHTYDRLERAEWAVRREDGEADDDYERRLVIARATILGIEQDDQEDHHGFKERVSSAASTLKNAASRARQKIGKSASGAAGGVKRGAGGVKHGVSGAAGGVKRGVSGAASGAKQSVGRASTVVKQTASDLRGRAHSGVQTLGHQVSSGAQSARMVQEDYPLAVGAFGFAIGALLGSVLPLTEVETRRLAPIADKGLAAGAQAARKGAEIANKAAAKSQNGNGSSIQGEDTAFTGSGYGDDMGAAQI